MDFRLYLLLRQELILAEKKKCSLIKAINRNILSIADNIEKAIFDGTYRAMARFHEPIDEVEIEKVHRLRQDGWKWKDIVKNIYPDTSADVLASEVNRIQAQYRRELKHFQRSAGGFPSAR